MRLEIGVELPHLALGGIDPGGIFRLPLAPDVELGQLLGIGARGRVGGPRTLGREPVIGRLQAAQLGGELALIGVGKGRVEGGQHLVLLDLLSDFDGDGADDRGFQRLHHDLAIAGGQFAIGADDNVDLGDQQPRDNRGDQPDHQPQHNPLPGRGGEDGLKIIVDDRARRGSRIRRRRCGGDGWHHGDAAHWYTLACWLHSPPLIHHDDRIGAGHKREAVGDDDNRAATRDPAEMLLDDGLAFRVERAGCLIENQDGRVVDQGPGDGQPLALTAREIGGALLEHRRIAMRQALNELMRAGNLRHLDHLLQRGGRLGHGNVLTHGAAEQEILLQHDADPGAQMGQVELFQIVAVDLDQPGLRHIEPLQ